jgi:hypothetical protein
MTYVSLFDVHAMEDTRFEKIVPERRFQGSMDQLVELLMVELKALNGVSGVPSIPGLLLNTPRLVIGAMGYKIAEQREGYLDLVRSATEVAMSIYGQNPEAAQELERFVALAEEEHPSFMDYHLEQSTDNASWRSSNPRMSQTTAEILIGDTNASDILFIPLGNGGIGPGLDVFLRYIGETGSENSNIYPVRFSTFKRKDKAPSVNSEEIAFLNAEKEGREVIIFDEDSYTGNTMLVASKFFETILNRDVFTTVNYEYRGKE